MTQYFYAESPVPFFASSSQAATSKNRALCRADDTARAGPPNAVNGPDALGQKHHRDLSVSLVRDSDPDIFHRFHPSNDSSALVGGRGILVLFAWCHTLADRVPWFAAAGHRLRLWPRGDSCAVGLANGRTRQ